MDRSNAAHNAVSLEGSQRA